MEQEEVTVESSSIVDNFREARTAYLNLHDQARKAMEAEYHDLIAQAQAIQKELKEVFNVRISPKSTGKKRGPKPGAKKEVSTAKLNTGLLEKQIAKTQEKITVAEVAGANTSKLEDKLYELKDKLRLAKEE